MRKALSLILCLCLLLSLSCVVFAEGFTPGEYEASAQGFGGAVTVKLSFDADKVVAASVEAYIDCINKFRKYILIFIIH